MTGCLREVALMVLKLNFLSSAPTADEVLPNEEVDMADVRREWAGFGIQRDFSRRPWWSV